MVRFSDNKHRSSRLQAPLVGAPKPKRSVQQRYMLKIAIVTFLVSLSASADITERGRGMLFGADHAFAVTAKSGWVLDNQSGAGRGIHMIFYPKGETWSESPVIIYGRAVSATAGANVRSQVERTVDQFRRNGSPNYSSKEQAPLILPSGQKAELFLYSGDQWGNYEAVAYFQETDTINFLVFNSRTKENFDNYFGDFRQIVSTYQNLYRSPTTNSGPKLDSLKREASSFLAKPGGQEYETKANRAIGQMMANAMRSCTSYLRNRKLPPFSYYVRIDGEGSVSQSNIFPTNALSVCVSGWMSNAKYPAHTFGSVVLEMNIKIAP